MLQIIVFFKGIKKLMPGETLKFDLKTKTIISVKRDIILGGNGSSYNEEEFRNILVVPFKKVLLEHDQ